MEAAILRCLETDPRRRPASALAVAAALPGRDPLAAALAAGDTPSPQMVARAGDHEGLRPPVAWACLLAVLTLLALPAVVPHRSTLMSAAPLTLSGEVLAAKGRELIGGLGHDITAAASMLRDHEGFLDLMTTVQQPLLAILLAAAFTALVQSSTATVGVVIVLASQGFVTLETSIALLFGANVGTCVTAGLAALGKPRPALQAALVHVLFNLFGVLIWLPCIRPLADLVRQVSPTAPGHLSAGEQIASELPRQVANAHVLFNLGTLLVLLLFAPQLAQLVRRIVPNEGD